MASLSRRSDTPKTLGLCPGEHLREFYMPDAEPGDICPECDHIMLVYVPAPTPHPAPSTQMLDCEPGYYD